MGALAEREAPWGIVVQGFGDAEVEQFHAEPAYHDVFEGYVAMHHGLVRVLERGAQGAHDFYGFVEWARAAPAEVFEQGNAVDVFHGEVELEVFAPNVVYRDDVFVAQSSRKHEFVCEACAGHGVREAIRPDDFQGDVFVGDFVEHLVDECHAAFAEQANDFELIGEDVARGKGEGGAGVAR